MINPGQIASLQSAIVPSLLGTDTIPGLDILSGITGLLGSLSGPAGLAAGVLGQTGMLGGTKVDTSKAESAAYTGSNFAPVMIANFGDLSGVILIGLILLIIYFWSD